MKTTKELPAPIYQAVGAKMRLIRDMLDISQEDLAKRTGMSRPAIANIEVGRQRLLLDQIETIAKALGTTPKAFLKGIWL